jgi:hypothetical protein
MLIAKGSPSPVNTRPPVSQISMVMIHVFFTFSMFLVRLQTTMFPGQDAVFSK